MTTEIALEGDVCHATLNFAKGLVIVENRIQSIYIVQD